MNPEQQRLKNKLALWDTPGFSQFLDDLTRALGPTIGLQEQVEALRKVYKAKIKEMEGPSKFKQTKLPL